MEEKAARIETLLEELTATLDPSSRDKLKELIQAVMELHAAGLSRALEIVSKAAGNGEAITQSLARDDLVSSLLVLYDLHPDDFETRVKRGLEKAERVVHSRGASLQTLAIGEGTVSVRIESTRQACATSGADLENVVRNILFEAAPDALEVVIEAGQAPALSSGFVPLASLQTVNGSV